MKIGNKRAVVVMAVALGGAGIIAGALFGGGKSATAQPAPVADSSCANAALALDRTEITSARIQQAGTSIDGAVNPGLPGMPGGTVSGLPEFCRVIGHIHPEAGSDIGFEVWLPTDGWDGRPSGAEVHMNVPFPGSPSPLPVVLNVTVPTLTVFRPAAGKATGAAVIVCPGGGFQGLAIGHEGAYVAKWLADRGVTAFVLKYRVRVESGFRLPTDVRRHPEQFGDQERFMDPARKLAVADGIQAIRYLRANAGVYGIAPDRIGIMGFSAGALTTMGVIMDTAPADRPNFGAPIYGSMEDKAPPKDGPPLFIAAAQDDPTVPPAKSLAVFSAWTAAGLPAELHIFETGGHGFGLLKQGKATDNWPIVFEAWLKAHHWATSADAAPARN